MSSSLGANGTLAANIANSSNEDLKAMVRGLEHEQAAIDLECTKPRSTEPAAGRQKAIERRRKELQAKAEARSRSEEVASAETPASAPRTRERDFEATVLGRRVVALSAECDAALREVDELQEWVVLQPNFEALQLELLDACSRVTGARQALTQAAAAPGARSTRASEAGGAGGAMRSNTLGYATQMLREAHKTLQKLRVLTDHGRDAYLSSPAGPIEHQPSQGQQGFRFLKRGGGTMAARPGERDGARPMRNGAPSGVVPRIPLGSGPRLPGRRKSRGGSRKILLDPKEVLDDDGEGPAPSLMASHVLETKPVLESPPSEAAGSDSGTDTFGVRRERGSDAGSMAGWGEESGGAAALFSPELVAERLEVLRARIDMLKEGRVPDSSQPEQRSEEGHGPKRRFSLRTVGAIVGFVANGAGKVVGGAGAVVGAVGGAVGGAVNGAVGGMLRRESRDTAELEPESAQH
ncbi:unnamed protein product [Pedinophyceae sp. YPF-701]|nr:unnamed protein product [Pedinophyceae sp. YPF-701]